MNLKNITNKIIATLVSIYFVLGNCAVTGLGIAEAIAEDMQTPKLGIEQSYEKYIQYEKETYKGAVVQTNVSIKETEGTHIPINNMEIQIKVPSINGILPDRVSIIKSNTILTNGTENYSVNQDYNKDTGLLNISYENKEIDGKIYSEYKENAKDEFEIIYIYPESAYAAENEQRVLVQEINTEAIFKINKNTLKSTARSMISETKVADSDDLINYETKSASEIYKGFMYSNETNKTNYATDYKTISEVDIFNSEIIDTIKIGLEKTVFNLNNNTELSTNSVQYRYTKISEYDFNKVFGQDGELDFYIGNTKYAAIKYGEADNKGKRNFVTEYYTQEKQNIEAGKVEYPIGTVNVRIESSKPVSEGKLYLENSKQIVSQSNYGAKVSTLKNITEIRSINATKNDQVNQEDRTINIGSKTNRCNIELKEPTTQISFELSNNKLSTLTTNKITATIKINDTNSSCKLVNGGNIELTLPDNTTNATVLSAKSLYENGISIKKAKVENGKVILEIAGKQTTYDTLNISGGVNIVLDLELDIADSVATHKENINLAYNNVQTSKEIEISSVNNVLIVSKTTGYDEQNTEISNIGSNIKAIQISENTSAKEVKHTISVVNNYEDNIQDVQIIGRIGYSDSTFETKLTKALVVNKNDAKVYYSNNKDASFNDTDWVEKFSTNAKSYKVVLKNNTLAKSDSVEIDLYAQIPANLGVNQSTFLRTDLDYKYNNENKSTFSMTNLYTAKEEVIDNDNEVKNENENLELTVTPFITQNYVHAGQRVIYRVRIGNRTNHKLENIALEDIVPENAIYTYKAEREGQGANYFEVIKDENKKTVNWNVSALEANSYKEFEIILTVKDNITQEQDIINTVNATYNGQKLSVASKLTVKPAKITVDFVTSEEKYMNISYYPIGYVVEYLVNIKNITNNKLSDITVKYSIPKNLEFIEGGFGNADASSVYSINEQGRLDNNTFEYNISNLNPEESRVIVIRCKVKKLQSSFEADINSIVNVKIGEDNYQSNVKTIKTIQPGYTISLESNPKATEVLEKGDEIVYTIVVKNIGKTSGGFTILDSIPEQIEVKNLSYKKGNGEVVSISTSKNNINFDESLNVGETIIINIGGTVKEIIKNENTVNISNFVILKDGEYEQKSNEIINKIKCINSSTDNPNNPDTPENPDDPDTPNNPNTPENPDNPNTPENPDNPDEPSNPDIPEAKTYSLSGVAWLDINKDGKRDENEQLLSGINVYLVNTETGKIVTDSDGNEINVLTGENGEYKFEGIPEGSYLVIFEFDTNKYKATRYQNPMADSTLNSDAIISRVTIDGNEKIVGATNVLDLKADTNNIDIGLIEDAKFDLSLEKQISKISVINTQGTKTTEYENLNFAKVDLVAKYMNNTSVIVTYKFIVTNNGDVTGYVDSLQDDLPKGLEFSSELNKDWYKGEDGKLYTESLSGIAIEPGKTSGIELILTKETTEESTGTFTNNAELAKISNIEAVDEAQKDNNKSSADLLLSIKTGSPILYIGITLGSATVIAVGAYIIKKKILDREI